MQQRIILLFLVLGNVFLSCEINPEKQIPSYIHVDRIRLKTDYSEQGTNRGQVSDVWVYVDQEYMGTYELPVTIPVLLAGQHTIQLRPGIVTNDNILTRNWYSFYTTASLTATLTPGSVYYVPEQEVSYISSAKFPMKEDFETGASLDSTSNSKTSMKPLYDTSLVFEGSASGAIYLNETEDFFECRTNNHFILPKNSSVFLELHYSSNNDFFAGLFVRYNNSSMEGQTIIQRLTSTNGEWKKVYISLAGTISRESNTKDFDVFFGGGKSSSNTSSFIFLDNIKIVHE